MLQAALAQVATHAFYAHIGLRGCIPPLASRLGETLQYFPFWGAKVPSIRNREYFIQFWLRATSTVWTRSAN
jgi:hypothetical protein